MRQLIRPEIFATVKSTPKEIAWATDLCHKNRDELGAIHLGVLAAHATLGHLLIAQGQGQFLGALISKPRLTTDARAFPIIGAAVPSDIRRLHVGLNMLAHLSRVHRLAPDRIIEAKTRADLPCNWFWWAAGFTPSHRRDTSSTRGKPIIVWRRRVDGRELDHLTFIEPARPRAGGGRFIPADRLDLATKTTDDPIQIYAALRLAGLAPGTFPERWTADLHALAADTERLLFPSADQPAQPTADAFR